MYRLIIGILLLVATPAAGSAANDFPYGAALAFAAVRNGQTIGHHRLTFQRDGAQLTVSTTIELTVKIMGFTAYRYAHRAQEIWNGDVFQSLASRTDANGKQFAVQIRRDGSHLAVEGSVGADTRRATLPLHLLPSSHWNVRQTREPALVNTQDGTEAKVQVTTIGRDTVVTANARVDATHYRYTGDIAMDQWFDDAGRWVKTAFTAADGSTVEYRLQ